MGKGRTSRRPITVQEQLVAPSLLFLPPLRQHYWGLLCAFMAELREMEAPENTS